MRNVKLVLVFLAISFAVLMSIPFLVPHAGMFALVGFVPLLLMEAVAEAHHVKRFFLWQYGAFVLWNAVTTFWVCNATVAGGIFAILANAAQMSVIFALFRFSKSRFGGVLPYIFLASAWIAWEHFYFNAEISWPWLVLGNSFARSIRCIQWYEYTGTLGGSLWIWVCNIWIFRILESMIDGSWTSRNLKMRISSCLGLVIALSAPIAVSAALFHRPSDDSGDSMDVVIGQPNFDPYHKFNALSQAQQNVIFLDIVSRGLTDYRQNGFPTLFIAPETFTNDIVLDRIPSSPTWQRFQSFLENYPDANFLFGASTIEFVNSEHSPSPNARSTGRPDLWYICHNSALMTDRTDRTEYFHKSKLVVGTELTPYPKFFSKIDNLLGGVMGRCVGQDSISVLHCQSYQPDGSVRHSVPVGSVICYESAFGEYCTGYVKKGARALVVITNDAWWGNTPGYKQHLSFSSLRAIETRRDIARCANTGISAFIDQRGVITSRSEWWKEQCMKGSLQLNEGVTFFVSHGDVTGRVCAFLFCLLALSLFVSIVTKKRDKLN